MTTGAESAEQFVRLLIWIGGIGTAVFGSWAASKIRVYHDNRNAHREDIRQRVLVPFRDALVARTSRAVSGLEPILSVQQGAKEFFENAKVTEPQTEQGEFLVEELLGTEVFGVTDSALLEDARRNHFHNLAWAIDRFFGQWSGYVGQCHIWASSIARAILQKSGLDAHPAKQQGSHPAFYVMNQRLAFFVYARLFGFPTTPLRIGEQSRHWALNGDTGTLAWASKEQIEQLIDELNKLLKSEAERALVLREEAAKLQENFNALIRELEVAIASRHLRGRCDLVTFF